MSRRKGLTYRKWNTKKIIRVRCPGWTIRTDVLGMVKHASGEIGVHESRIVEVAIQSFLNNTSRNSPALINPDKIFSKT